MQQAFRDDKSVAGGPADEHLVSQLLHVFVEELGSVLHTFVELHLRQLLQLVLGLLKKVGQLVEADVAERFVALNDVLSV